jgi:hypothetical protein
MPIQDIVNVDISIQSAGLGQADFGTPIVLGLFTSPQNTAFGSDLTAELTPTTWRSVLTGLGFASSDAAWLAFASLFGQARRPSLALIARRATPVAQVVNVNVDGAGDGTYTVTINGVDFDFVASSNTATQIKDGLIAAIQGGSEPVTAASVDSDTLSLTADTAGVPFTLALSAPSDDLSSSVITASVGIDTDLAAIEAERSDWYFVMETSRVLETQQVAVEAIESFDVRTLGDVGLLLVSAVVGYTAVSASGEPLRTMHNRLSWGLRTKGHGLRIVHEHTSAPVGFEDMKAILQRPVGS